MLKRSQFDQKVTASLFSWARPGLGLRVIVPPLSGSH